MQPQLAELSGFFDRYGNRITTALYLNDVWIATDFQLFDLDNNGIPEVLVHCHKSTS